MKHSPLVSAITLIICVTSQRLAAPAESDRPNVLFVLADDLGIGDLACYGNPYLDTPVIDALAAQGIRFTDHYSPSPLCAPARAGFLTGRFNHRTGAVDVSSNRGVDRIALSERTFGDCFRHAGYATALIGKWHNGLYCNDYLPHHRGFDLFFGFPNGGHDYWNWHLMRNGQLERSDGRYLSDVLNDEAIAFIRRAGTEGKPFALFLAHHAPHPPLQAPPNLVDKYKRRVGGVYDESVAIMYAMIEAMDTGIGRVLEEIEQRGLAEDTIVVFTSDNGANLGGSGRGDSCNRYHGVYQGNKGNVLEQGIRVPAIVSWPGRIPGGRVCSTPIHGCDWLPTLFGLTNAAPPVGCKPWDGVDLMPLLRCQPMPELQRRDLPFQKTRYTPVSHSDACLRSGDWKLYWPGERRSMSKDMARDNPSYLRGIEHPHWEMPLDAELPDHAGVATERPRLYHLADDPGEQHDLAARYPERVRAMAARYDRWFEEVFAQWMSANQEIRRYDEAYWRARPVPDPRPLFDAYWQWQKTSADAERDNPLEVFRGYWSDR
jgi:arylsulfatase A